MTDRARLLEKLRLVHRTMDAAHQREGRKMLVYKDVIEVVEAAIKVIEKMGEEE